MLILAGAVSFLVAIYYHLSPFSSYVLKDNILFHYLSVRASYNSVMTVLNSKRTSFDGSSNLVESECSVACNTTLIVNDGTVKSSPNLFLVTSFRDANNNTAIPLSSSVSSTFLLPKKRRRDRELPFSPEINAIMQNETYITSRFVTIPSVPFIKHGNESIDYFPWNDGVDYNDLCSRILKRITISDTYYVIADSIPGGIGHKYTSLLFSVTYAVLTGRRFLMYAFDAFYNETNSCLRDLRYTGPIDIFPRCYGYKGCKGVDHRDALGQQPEMNIVFRDFRPDLFTSKNLHLLRKLKLIPRSKGWNYWKRCLIRILLNPSKLAQQMILKERERMGHVLLSAHVRCGGNFADFHEKTVMVSNSQIKQFIKQIRHVVRRNKSPSIYVSSDSSKAVSEIQSKMKEVKVYSVEGVRGHSTDGRFEDVRQTLVHMILLCNADKFVGTDTSAFSHLVVDLCSFRQRRFVRVVVSYVEVNGNLLVCFHMDEL